MSTPEERTLALVAQTTRRLAIACFVLAGGLLGLAVVVYLRG